MSTASHPKAQPPATLLYGIESKPHAAKSLTLGAQQVVVSNVWLDPIFIASVGGLSAALAGNLVSITFMAAGIVTLIQTTRLVRLPIVEGPSSAFDPFVIAYAKAGQLPAASTGILIGAAIVFLAAVSGLLRRVQRVFTPAVTGTIILLVGISLAQFTFLEFFGGVPDAPDFASGTTTGVAALTTLLVIVLTRLPHGIARPYAFLVALVVGDLVCLAVGRLDFSSVGDASWFGLPQVLPYGALTFDPTITVAMTIVFVVVVVEAIGIYHATADYTGADLTPDRLRNGIAGEAAGSALAGVFGGFGTTAYAQNLGLIRLTGVASRHTVRLAACLLIALAFLPKIGAVLAATPAPVIGGLFLPAAATVVFTGMRIIARTDDDSPGATVASLAIMAGLGIPTLGAPLLDTLPSVLGDLGAQPIIVGATVAIALQLLMVVIPDLVGARTSPGGYGDTSPESARLGGRDRPAP